MDAWSVLAGSPLFARLSPETLGELAAHAEFVHVPSGRTLIEQGAAPDSMYIVVTGRLRAILPGGQVAGDIGQRELLGEIGVISGEPRVAAVYAVRDSVVLRLMREALLSVLERNPAAMIEITRVIIGRLRQNQRVQRLAAVRSVRTFAVVPATADADAAMVAAGLRDALSVYCAPRLIDAPLVDSELGPGSARTSEADAGAHGRMVEYLSRIESEHQHLIYLAGSDADAWSRRCMRQADRILLVVGQRSTPLASAMVEELRTSGTRAPVDVVMVRPPGTPAAGAIGWRAMAGSGAHYYVRPNQPSDFAALARSLTGRAIGLVLGGGGARGFAHIGLMRALRELNLPIDVIGGSSMGAFFSGLIACGYDHHEMAHLARETFVANNYLNDYLFPSIALIRGRKIVRRLHDIFDERQIEDLRMPYFCVSTNLTRGTPMVHDRGPLYMWVATSMAVPGVAPPVVYKGELLADGAVINSLPTDVMQGLERGPIIASDVSTEGGISAPGIEGPDPEGLLRWGSKGERPGLFSIIFRTATLTSESGVAARAARADLYIRMPVIGIGLFDWKKMDEIVERGYQVALEKLTPMREHLLKGG
ncbi:MAG TPA: patatin-like phospholipase family protein [Solimonas sp.]|nr:patatin-like phospholipase family protein [Solimonas sp.]